MAVQFSLYVSAKVHKLRYTYFCSVFKLGSGLQGIVPTRKLEMSLQHLAFKLSAAFIFDLLAALPMSHHRA